MGFGFSLGGSKSKSSTTPWGPQGDMLKNLLYPQATQLYNRGVYQGDWAAPINPYQTQATTGGADLYDLAGQVAGNYGQAGASLAPNLNAASNFYNNVAANGTGYQNPLAGGLNMDLVNQVANNPTLNGVIDAALRDPYRQFSEQTMPGIAAGAVGSGNTGSSRRGIAEGIATRGFQDRATDIAAQVRGDAYNQGLGVAGQFADYAQQGQMGDIVAKQNAAYQLSNLGQTGMGYMADQYNFGQTGAQNLAGWGDYSQGLEQGQIDADMAKFMAPWDLLNMVSGVVQAGNWGGTTKGKTTSFGIGYK